MLKVSFSDGLGICSIACGFILVALDKAGKLKGPLPLILLGIAALTTLPLALGNSWVSDAPSSVLRVTRSLLMVCGVCTFYSALAVWIATGTPAANEHADLKPPTLHELFKDDFTHGFKMSGDWFISTAKDGVLTRGDTTTIWDFNSRVKFIAFFVPSSDHSYVASRALVDRVDKEFESKQSQLALETHGFGTSTELKDLVFSGRVFLYHADNFTLRQLADLVDAYKAKGMSLEFRGPDYLAMQVVAWHRKHDKKQSNWNIISRG